MLVTPNNRKPRPERFTTMSKALLKLQTKLRDERGATAVEYGLMVALIAAVIIAAVILLGDNVSSVFDSVATAIGTR